MSFCPSCKKAHDKTETRAAILASAKELFGVERYEDVGLRDIAAGVGCSTRAIFAFWKTKAELFSEAMGRPPLDDEKGSELLAALKAVAPDQADQLLSRWVA